MKLSHADVDYGPGNPRGDHCAICVNFILQGPHCTEVVDPIEPMGWCVRFRSGESNADDAA